VTTTPACISGVLVEAEGVTLRPEDCAGRPAGPEVGPAEQTFGATGPGIAQLVTRWAPRASGVNVPGMRAQVYAPGSPFPSGPQSQQASIQARTGSNPYIGWLPPWVHVGSSSVGLPGSLTVVNVDIAPARNGDAIDSRRAWMAVIRSDGLLVVYQIRDGAVFSSANTALQLSSNARCAVLGYDDGCKVLVLDEGALIVVERKPSTGTSWFAARITSQTVLLVGTPPAFSRLTAAHRDGQAVLFATRAPGSASNRVLQLGSYDDGWSWQVVADVTAGVAVSSCAASRAGIHVIHADEADTASNNRRLRHSILSGPGVSWRETDFVGVGRLLYTNPTAGEVFQSAHGLSVQEDGRLVLVCRNGQIITSEDYGASWFVSPASGVAGREYAWAEADNFSLLRAIPHEGGTLAITTHDDPAAAPRRNVRFDRLGGWASFSTPAQQLDNIGDRDNWSVIPRYMRTVLPYATPTSYGYAETGSGTLAVGRDGFAITGGTLSWLRTFTYSVAMQDYITAKIEGSWTGTVTGATAAGPLHIEIQSGNLSSNGARLRAVVTSDTVAIYEWNGSAFVLLASAAHTVPQTRICLFVTAYGTGLGDLRVEARVYASSGWVEAVAVQGNATGTVAQPSPNSFIRFSASNAVVGVSDLVVYSMGENLGPSTVFVVNAGPAKAQMVPETGRPLRIEGVYVRDTVTLEPTEGVLAIGQTWSIETAFRFGFANALIPSPRVPYRTEEHTGTYDLAVNIPPGDTQLAVALIDCDARNVTISVYFEGIGWTDMVTTSTPRRIAVVAGFGTGASVVLSGGDLRAKRNELIGHLINNHRIAANTQGQTGATLGQRTFLTVTAPTITGGTAGPVEIIPRVSMYVLPSFQSATPLMITRIRVRFGGEGTARPNGGISLGRLVVGPFIPFPDRYDWGRRIERQARTTTEETRDGTRVTRADGPPRRVIEMDWQEGVDTWGATRDTDLGTGVIIGTDPVTTVNTTPYEVAALHGIADGDRRDCVLVPRIANPGSAGIAVAHRVDQVIYGNIQGTLSLDTAQGEENEGEVYRLSLTFTEQT
jgi:hypothetical protein